MSNLQASLAWRLRVLLYLRDEGFPGVEDAAEEPARSVSEFLSRGSPLNRGDILGLPWTLGVRNQVHLDLASALYEVESEAEDAGTEFYASIQRRRGAGPGQAYVTLPLAVFVKVLRRMHPELTDEYANRGRAS